MKFYYNRFLFVFSPLLKKWYGVGISDDYRLSQMNATVREAGEIQVRKS